MDQNDRLPSHTYSHYFSLTSSLHLPAPFARGSQETERVAGFIAIIMEEFVHSRGTEQREQEAYTVRAPDLLFRLERDPVMRMGQNLEQLHYLFVLTFIALVNGRPERSPSSFLEGESGAFRLGMFR